VAGRFDLHNHSILPDGGWRSIVTKQLDVFDHRRDFAGLTYIYPVVSRRAGGVSIGINLNTNNACNWRCIYCQVPDLKRGSAPPIDLGLLERELLGFIDNLLHGNFMQAHVPVEARQIVDIAISGNGEPTTAQEFPEAVEIAGKARRVSGLANDVRLRLITNGSLVGRQRVREGLSRLGRWGGEVWFKVDAGTAAGFRRINSVELSPESVIRNLRSCAELCPTWVQTCLFAIDGQPPPEEELEAYVDLLKKAGIGHLAGVHLYGLARASRQPEACRLSSLPAEYFETVAERLRAQGLTVLTSP
jgi:wyosine [tRNA(Phe)-imidazoG37] synthetase (radical SAM superfamily)